MLQNEYLLAQRFVPILPRTSPLKFDHSVEKFGVKYGIVSFNLARHGSCAALFLWPWRSEVGPLEPTGQWSLVGNIPSRSKTFHRPRSSHSYIFLTFSNLKFWLIFGKLWEARSRLYRRQFVQVNTRSKALEEIYKIYMFLHRLGFNF